MESSGAAGAGGSAGVAEGGPVAANGDEGIAAWPEAQVQSYLDAGWTIEQIQATYGEVVIGGSATSISSTTTEEPMFSKDSATIAEVAPSRLKEMTVPLEEPPTVTASSGTSPTSTTPEAQQKPPISERLMMRFGIDITVLTKRETWVAFSIAFLLFSTIGFASLSLFEKTSDLYGSGGGDVRPADSFEVESVNRSWIEQGQNGTADVNGWFDLKDHRGEVVIIDFMAIACENCHYVQEHIDYRYDEWTNLSGPYSVTVISIGSWFALESLEQLDDEFGIYCLEWALDGTCSAINEVHMPWTVATANATSATYENGSKGSLMGAYTAHALPVAVVLDHEGFVVAREQSGTPLDGWKSFDDAVIAANAGEAEDMRLGIREEDNSMTGVFIIGLLLGILVYFSPCAFPVLPSYISYYINLGMREEELFDAGKLKRRMPGHFQIGGLAAAGQFTFFAAIGAIIYGLSSIIDLTPHLALLGKSIAVLLIVLGAFMLLGGTAHLLGWIQKFISKYQTTEDDEIFTPRRNMYLWGIGYSAASSDCTAAAVLPFIGYLAVIGGSAVLAGLAGIILSASALMIAVTVIVGLGRQKLLAQLRAATGLIKSTGAWMMMLAGIGLLIYLTQAELIAGVIA